MQAPSDEVRAYVRVRAEQVDSDEELLELLDWIDDRVRQGLAPDEPQLNTGSDVAGSPEEQAWTDLAKLESWASLASFAVASLSAPGSPFPFRLAGWGEKAVGKLRDIADRLKGKLQDVGDKIGADSISIGVAFPWGVQVSLNWPVAPAPGGGKGTQRRRGGRS
jgi:hypothetical protein